MSDEEVEVKTGKKRKKTLGESKKDIREREAKMLELIRSGRSDYEIAEILGFHSTSGVTRMRKRIFERQIMENVDEIRSTELDRLDALLQSVWHKARTGNDRAIESALKIMAAKRKYIPNLEVPVKSEISGSDGAPFQVVMMMPTPTADDVVNEDDLAK